MNLWSGRFSKQMSDALADFNSSIQFDARLYGEDITGSIAHAEMLAKQGIIPKEAAAQITAELSKIREDIANGKIELSRDNEDIHMNVETILTQRIGAFGKMLHTARSRNDQVALDLRLYVKKEIPHICSLAAGFIKSLVAKAKENTASVMPGYTHLQRAQPVTFAHYMMAYAQMIKRDILRLENCLELADEMPLGSGALAATTYDIDRDFVCKKLGFARITENSLDGVSDRDFAVELVSDISIMMMHLSRFAEEIIHWCSWEFKFIELDDAYATGSSIMPQKKNPDITELVRGKTGRVYGSLISLLTMMKALPLAYNKDMQEDKEAVFDAVDTIVACLTVLAPMVDTMKTLPDNMRAAANGGFINATDCADYIVSKGIPFRDAYTITGKLVALCIEKGKALDMLTLDEFHSVSPVFDDGVYDAINLDNCVNRRKIPGGPAETEVLKQIERMNKFLAERNY